MQAIRTGVLALALVMVLSACTMSWQDVQTGWGKIDPTLREPTLAEILELTQTTLKKEAGWTYKVKRQEKLTRKQQQTVSQYEAKISVTSDPYAMRSQGTITSKGKSESEQLVMIGDKGYLKIGNAPWKASTPAEMRTNVEDPTQALIELTTAVKQKSATFRMVETNGFFRVTAELPPGRAAGILGTNARAELEPSLAQLRGWGIRVNPANIRLKSYKREVHIDSKTHVLHAVLTQFSFEIPTPTGTVTFQQTQTAEVSGVFKEKITLPIELRPKAK